MVMSVSLAYTFLRHAVPQAQREGSLEGRQLRPVFMISWENQMFATAGQFKPEGQSQLAQSRIHTEKQVPQSFSDRPITS